MITMIAGWLAPMVGKRFARAAAWVAIVIALIPTLLILKTCYDRGVIENATNEANVEFLGDKNEAAGKADLASDERQAAHDERVKTTGDLVDEAIEDNCIVSIYLASNGDDCVHPGDPVPNAAAE